MYKNENKTPLILDEELLDSEDSEEKQQNSYEVIRDQEKGKNSEQIDENGKHETHHVEIEMINLKKHINSIEIMEQDSFHTKTLKTIKINERSHFLTKKFILVSLNMLLVILTSTIRNNLVPGLLPHVSK